MPRHREAIQARVRELLRQRRRRRVVRLMFEALEGRMMLDAAPNQVPSPIVVGRTLSAYTVGAVQDNQVTITYTVYNEQASPETGVLLTTTLAPGVTFAGASSPPDRSGQEFAWSLGTIPAFDRASVSVTVNLAGPTPLVLDSGVRAFATLDGAAVTDAAPAATLRAGSVDPALLASTADANAADPFIQEEAARLDYDPQRIFDVLHTEVGYESYSGSVRGARGTLWSEAGNALDVASLGVALMRASGIPARYARGTLAFNQAQQLILSMFPPNLRTVGHIPAGTQVSNPAGDGRLLNEAADHYWFQFDSGGGFQDADPLVAAAAIGQAFTSPSGTFAEVPDNLRAKTRLTLSAETFSQAAALFGLGGPSRSVVLDRTFNDVELVGRTLTIGNLVNTSAVGALVISARTTTYTPYVIVGGDSFDPTHDHTITGTPYQEVLTNFPLGTQVVTGLFLDITLSGPGGSSTHQRTLADRIGTAARLNGSGGALATDPDGPPLISPLDLATLSVTSSRFSEAALRAQNRVLDAMQQRLVDFQARVLAAPAGTERDALQSQADAELRDVFIAMARSRLAQFNVLSDSLLDTLQTESRVRAYLDSPRITIFSSTVSIAGDGAATVLFSVDLRKDDVRTIVAPGNNPTAAIGFNVARGFLESEAEASALGDPPQVAGVAIVGAVSASRIFGAAEAQGVPLVLLSRADAPALDALPLPPDAKALITVALQNGRLVLVPATPVSIGGQPQLAWYEMNQATGETIGVLPSGQHQALVEYKAAQFAAEQQTKVAAFGLGVIAGIQVNTFKTMAIFILKAFLNQVLPDWLSAIKQIISVVSKLEAIFAALADLPFSRSQQFAAGFLFGLTLSGALATDPPIPDMLSDPDFRLFPPDPDQAESSQSVSPSLGAGNVQATLDVPSVQARGALAASWSSQGTGGFRATSLSAGSATVRDAQGNAVGTGTVSLAATTGVAVAVDGNVAYQVSGQGTLAFYAPGASGLGASGDWTQYAASLSGTVTLRLTTAALVLNGTTLPAGTYLITTAAATLAGAGPTSSPNFVGTASITATGATVALGAGAGGLAVGGTALDPRDGATLGGYNGTIAVTANAGGSSRVTLAGSSASVLLVSADTPSISTDQNTPKTFRVQVRTSRADTYSLSVQAPTGWTVAIDASGNVTVTPAPGTQSGTFPIRVVARSNADPNLVAQAVVNVSITATQPGIALSVTRDLLFTVPVGAAQVPSAFRAAIQNTGPASDTFTLTFPNLPPGFTLFHSGTAVTVPAGETGILGVYLRPTGTLPPPGTQVSFTVVATSQSDPTITQTQVVSFVIPAIDAVSLSADPAQASTTPGVPVTVSVTVTNAGNVPETGITLTATMPNGLVVTGFSPVTLQPGESATLTITLTPAASTPLGSRLETTITAAFGASGALTQTLKLPILIVAPGVAAVSNASAAAAGAGRPELAARLHDLGTALTTLFQNPADPVARGQATANLDSLITQTTRDPFLAPFTAGLSTARDAIAASTLAADVQSALTALAGALDALATTIADEGAHGFTLALEPSRIVAQPQVPSVFTIALKNTGSRVTTYVLSVSGLPAGVAGALSQTRITLNPGQEVRAGSGGPTLTLTQSGGTLVPATFTITATAEGAPAISGTTRGALALRDAFLQVATVIANPTFVAPGATGAAALVQVSARVQAALNQPQTNLISYVAADAGGNVVFRSTPVPLVLDASSGLVTVDLGALDTTGLPEGSYTLIATITDATGQPLPNSSGTGTIVVGLPVTAEITTTPTTVPTGSYTVTTTVRVRGTVALPSPLTILGQVSTGDNELSTVLYNNLAYVVGLNGVSIVDVTDPANPQAIKTFAQSEIVQGGYNIAQVVGDKLIVATTITLNASGFNFIAYDLADPLNPTLIGNTPINHRFLGDMYILGDIALVTIGEINFFGGGNIFAQRGNTIALDISDLAHPTVAGVLFQSGDPEIEHPEGGAVIVNSQVAYVISSTSTGGDTQHGVGRVRILDISDPANPTLSGTLDIPGTVTLLNIELQGNRALVVGSTGGLLNPFGTLDRLKNTGNLTLTVLDVSDPDNPVILGETLVTEVTFPSSPVPTRGDLRNLGNGLFAQSAVEINGRPALLLIDASDPDNIVVSALNPPTNVNGLTVSGRTLYAATPTGLSIYDIGQLVSQPVRVEVEVPKDSSTFSLVAGSFDKPPTEIIRGTSFDTYVWNRSLAFGNTELSFSWKTTLSELNGGDVRDTTLGTRVGYQFSNATVTAALELAGTRVTAAPIIAITPVSQTARPGGPATFVVRLTNPLPTPVTYNVGTPGLGNGQAVLETNRVTLAGNSSTEILLTITPDPRAAAGSYPFNVNATDADGNASGFAVAEVVVAGPPIPAVDTTAHGIVAALTPAQATAGQGNEARYVVRVTNTGSEDEFASLSVDGLPQGVSAQFETNSFNLPPGASNFRDVALVLRTTAGTPAASYQFTVSARNSRLDTGTAAGTLVVLNNGVDVVLDPSSRPAGGGFEATVTNTGTVADTFDLSLAGPGALVSTLGSTSVTLAPGASAKVAISTTGVNFALPGTLNLIVIATSRTNAGAKDGDSADLTIAPARGVTATFAPASQSLARPGPATFLLTVQNTGNAEDSFEAVIVGTQGPVTALLMGLDGLLTRSIPVFRLPALATGVIELRAELFAALQQGLITVVVRSTTDGAIAATATASLEASASPPAPPPTTPPTPPVPGVVATTTVLKAAPARAVIAGNLVTLTATVRGAGGGRIPTGTVTFLRGSTVLGTVALNAKGQATLRLRTAGASTLAARARSLGVGRHPITAVYRGDANHSGSRSAPVTVVVRAATRPAGDGPRVTRLLRYGYHVQPTVLVVQFNRALSAPTAQALNNYTLVNLGGPGRGGSRAGRHISIRSAVYDPSRHTVTLYPAERLDLRNRYQLTIQGGTAGGVRDAAGRLLDGQQTGRPGSNFVGPITRASLAGATTTSGAIVARPAVQYRPPDVAASAIDLLASLNKLPGKPGASRR